MPGAISPNFHEGSRSEYLAQYVFSSWGTAVAVPYQEDHGLDLFCTLTERIGQRAWARCVYTVQVKSTMEPWAFQGMESVRWLVQHPLPLFLCVVDKSPVRLRVFQTTPRFWMWARDEYPDHIGLIPTTESAGRVSAWTDSYEFSLSAPIIDCTLEQLMDDAFCEGIVRVLDFWITVENANLTRLRSGLRGFCVPAGYRTNEIALSLWQSYSSHWKSQDVDPRLEQALPHFTETLDWIGKQLMEQGDLQGAVRAALLLRHLFKSDPWRSTSSHLMYAVNRHLGIKLRSERYSSPRELAETYCARLDELGRNLDSDLARLLESGTPAGVRRSDDGGERAGGPEAGSIEAASPQVPPESMSP